MHCLHGLANGRVGEGWRLRSSRALRHAGYWSSFEPLEKAVRGFSLLQTTPICSHCLKKRAELADNVSRCGKKLL